MAEIKNYLSYDGLSLYDELIKKYIGDADASLLSSITGGELSTDDLSTIKALSDKIKEIVGTLSDDDAKTLEAINNELDALATQISDKNVSAEGETGDTALVTANAEANKVTVASTQKLKDAVSAAETALQKADITTGSANGTIAVEGTDVAVAGLGSAAYTDSTTYATAAQGTLADSAIQTVKVNGAELTVTDKAVDITIPAATVTGVAEGDNVLSLNGTLLSSTIDLSYNSTDKKIYLKGKDNAVISTVDAADFIKDGMISNVAWSDAAGEENILVITFNTDAGDQVIKVDFAKLVDDYTAGDGINVNGKVVSVKIANATTDAVTLSADANGLSATLTGWDDVKAASHTHANQTVLDGITAEKVAAWDAKQDAMVAITEDEIAALFTEETSEE